MKLTGYICTVGELQPGEAPEIVGVPAVQLRLTDGRIVTITGLTRADCRVAAKLYMTDAVLSIGAAEKAGGGV